MIGLYAIPPIHGSKIVDIVLGDKELTESWKNDLGIMSSRIKDMRVGLKDRLEALGSPHDWSHITR